MPVHLLIESGRASRFAACDEPFANGQWGSEDMADVTCRACLALFPNRPVPPAEQPAENDAGGNFLAPDGYRYGVMFNDGSVACAWNGSTQRERASDFAERSAREYAPDNITLARRQMDGPWERVIPPAKQDGT